MRCQAFLWLLPLATASTLPNACVDEHCFEDDVSVSLLQTQLKVSRTAPAEVTPATADATPFAFAAPKMGQRAAEALAEAWDAVPRGTVLQNTQMMVLAITAAFTTFGMAISFMKADGKGKSVFRLVAQPISSSEAAARKAARKPSALPPWEVDPNKAGNKYVREAKTSKGSDARARQRAKVLKGVPLPPLSLDTVMSHDCFIVDMDGLAQLCQCKVPLDVKDVSGNTLLHAAVSQSVDGHQLLQLTLANKSDGPHAIVYGVGCSGASMTLFGLGGCEYGSIVPQDGGGSHLVREGQMAMQLQAGFAADLRIMALNADSDFVASGGRYLGVRRGAGTGDVWKLKVSSEVDSLLVVACMLATVLASGSQSSDATPTGDSDAIADDSLAEMDSESEGGESAEVAQGNSLADQTELCPPESDA